MKELIHLLIALASLLFAACAQDSAKWRERDPNAGISTTNDISDPNFLKNLEEPKEKVRLSGQVSVGVGTRF